MIDIGTRVLIMSNPPGVQGHYYPGHTGVVIPDYHKGETYAQVRIDQCGDRECGTEWTFCVKDLEIINESKLPEGYRRCKCGTITTNAGGCCDCLGKDATVRVLRSKECGHSIYQFCDCRKNQ